MQVFLTIKLANHVNKRGTITKGNNVSETVRFCRCITVIKYAQQTTGKQQWKCSVSWGKHLKVATTETESYANSTQISMFVHIQKYNTMPVSCNIIKLNGHNKSRRGGVYKWCGGTGFSFSAKNFTLQEVTTRFRGSANEMLCISLFHPITPLMT
jgi:hypothetical protein